MTVALLLEDEPLKALDLEHTLSGVGFDVTTVVSCAEALEWLGVSRPHIVIVDIILRDGPCHAVVQQLLDDGIPFIVHSADNPSVHAGTVMTKGIWLGKPSPDAELVRIALELAA